MAVTWQGWEGDILRAIGAPVTTNTSGLPQVYGNVDFLGNWYQSESPNCDWNPLVAYLSGSGSTACKALPNGHHAQNYASKSQAIAKTAAQFKDGDYPTLLKALRDNNIFAQSVWSGVALNLQRWGAVHAQEAYNTIMANTYGGPIPSGPPPIQGGTTFAPHTQHGWRELRQAINHRLHGEISQTNTAVHGALRTLRGGRKVH